MAKSSSAGYNLSGSVFADTFSVAVTNDTSVITAGVGKRFFRFPWACTVTGIRGYLKTAQASGPIFTVDVNEAGVSILSTKLTIDNTEKSSFTAVTPLVISDGAIANDAEMSADIDQVGTAGAVGLSLIFYVNRILP